MLSRSFVCPILATALSLTVGAYAASLEESEATSQLLQTGRSTFISNCGFCHGSDAQGGSRGLDLVRSELVAADSEGNLIGEVVRQGRTDKGMPAFNTVSGEEIKAIAAYIKQQKELAESANGSRRSVSTQDLLVGDAEAGRQYFQTHCSACHAATGDLAGVSTRYQGLVLLMRMLYPGSESRRAKPPAPKLTVITQDKQRFQGNLAYRDEFTVAMIGQDGHYRSWPTKAVAITIDDPLEAHSQQLRRYTDKNMHDVFAYLHTLK